MKNAVFYKDSWLAKTSQAYLLYEVWQKTKDNKDRKKLDDHVKDVDQKYKQLAGLV